MKQICFFSRISCLFVLGVLFLPVLGTAAPALSLNKIVAVVNGDMLTLHELRRAAMPELHKAGFKYDAVEAEPVLRQVLDSMIDDILLQQEATRLKIEVADAEVDNELRKIIQNTKMSPEQFEQRLALEGNSIERVRERLRGNILSQRMVTFMISRKVVVTPDSIEQYYNEHRGEFQAAKLVQISVLVFPPTMNPDDVVKKIKKNELSFADAVRQYSVGPSPADGGSLGNLSWHELASDWKALLEGLNEGEMTQIFRADDKFAVMRLDKISSGAALSLDEATPRIEEILRQPLLEDRFKEYTKQLRSRAVVDVRL